MRKPSGGRLWTLRRISFDTIGPSRAGSGKREMNFDPVRRLRRVKPGDDSSPEIGELYQSGIQTLGEKEKSGAAHL